MTVRQMLAAGLALNAARLGRKPFAGLRSGRGHVGVFLLSFFDEARFFAARTMPDHGSGNGSQQFSFNAALLQVVRATQCLGKVMNVVPCGSEAQRAGSSVVTRHRLSHPHANQIIRQEMHPQLFADHLRRLTQRVMDVESFAEYHIDAASFEEGNVSVRIVQALGQALARGAVAAAVGGTRFQVATDAIRQDPADRGANGGFTQTYSGW